MKKENLTKWIFVTALLIGLIIALSLAGYYLQEKQQSNNGRATLIIKSLGETTEERFNFSDGTALGLLKNKHKIKAMLNDKFIECIDDVCADGGYLWLFYVNNKTINYGVKRYKLNDGDIIMFEFTNRGG